MSARERLFVRPALRPGSLRVANRLAPCLLAPCLLAPCLLAPCLLALCLLAPSVSFPASASAQPASGDPLARADAAFEEGRVAEAGRAYEDAIESGALDPDGLARASLRLGIVCALGSEDARAGRHFANALALAPSLPTPEGLSDALAARFEALRSAREGRRVRVVVEVSGEDAPIGVDVRDAPPGLVRTIEIEGTGLRRTHAWDGVRIDFDVPSASRPIAARALDAHGNVIASAGARAAVSNEQSTLTVPALVEPVLAQPGLAAETAPDETPLIESPWLWIAVGVVAIAVGVVIGVTASGDRYVLNAPVVR